MQLIAQIINDITILSIVGSLTQSTAPQLLRWLAEQIPTRRRYIIDLSGVEQADSAGLVALSQMLIPIQAVGGDMVLCCVNKQLEILLTLTRLNGVFRIYATQEEAIAALEGDSSEGG